MRHEGMVLDYLYRYHVRANRKSPVSDEMREDDCEGINEPLIPKFVHSVVAKTIP